MLCGSIVRFPRIRFDPRAADRVGMQTFKINSCNSGLDSHTFATKYQLKVQRFTDSLVNSLYLTKNSMKRGGIRFAHYAQCTIHSLNCPLS